MTFRGLLPFFLAVAGLVLFGVVLTLGGNVVLYQASGDAFSPLHKDTGIVSVMTTEEAETIIPLMADIISQSYNVVIEIDAKDFEYSGRELSSYANLISRLKTNNAKIKLTNTEIGDFRLASDDLNMAMGVLNADVARMEELKQEIIANAGNVSALYALYSEVQVLAQEITLTSETYAETAEIMIEIAKGYNLDTSQLAWAIETVNRLADMSVQDSEKITSSSSSEAGLQILFTLSPATVAYGDTLKIEGSSRAAGLLQIYLDNDVWGTVNLSSPGSFTKSFKIEKISAGMHIVTIRVSGYVSKLAYFTVVSTPTVLTIYSTEQSDGDTAKKLTVIGKLETVNNLSVENAPVGLYADGIGIIANGTTNKYGVWSASAELEDGEYQIYAEFSDKSFPLGESRSEPVTVTISSPTLYYLILAAVGGVLIFCIVRIVRRRRGRIPDERHEFIVKNEDLPASPVQALTRAIRKIFDTPVSAGDSDKLRVLYRETVSVIAGHENIERVLTKTPREITSEVKYLTDEIKLFMTQYEYLHYADVSVTDYDMDTMRVLAGKIVEGYNENNE